MSRSAIGEIPPGGSPPNSVEPRSTAPRVLATAAATCAQDTQDRINVIKSRLIKYYGYNEASANDVLSFVASIFARGDVKE